MPVDRAQLHRRLEQRFDEMLTTRLCSTKCVRSGNAAT